MTMEKRRNTPKKNQRKMKLYLPKGSSFSSKGKAKINPKLMDHVVQI